MSSTLIVAGINIRLKFRLNKPSSSQCVHICTMVTHVSICDPSPPRPQNKILLGGLILLFASIPYKWIGEIQFTLTLIGDNI